MINHEIKLMEMGGREEILLERETIILIIPSMKRDTIYRR
jgi:hypothetical protein